MRTLAGLASLAVLFLAVPAAADPRDPFASSLDDEIACFGRTPLERVALAAVTVQGVVAETAAPRALLKLPDGTVHLARVGDGIGPSFGRIAAIRAGGIEVLEVFRDPLTGRSLPQRTVLALR